jgi:hypothetical protein
MARVENRRAVRLLLDVPIAVESIALEARLRIDEMVKRAPPSERAPARPSR